MSCCPHDAPTNRSRSHLTVYRAQITVSIATTCGNDGERTQGAETHHMTWSISPDAQGLEWLSLTHDDGTIEKYRRWTH